MSDLSQIFVTQPVSLSREEMLQYQQQSFRQLLGYVWKHSAFYRDYYESCGIREKDLADLTIRDLPFLSKKTLMANFDAAVTDKRLQRKPIERWLEENRDPRQEFRKEFIVMHSSGSSGDIGIFVYNRTAWQVMNSTVAAHFPSLGNHRSGKMRAAVYMASHGHFAGITTAVQMPKSAYDTLILSLLEEPTHVIEQLNAFQPHRLIGYSSCITTLAEWAIEGTLRIQPQRITVSGDWLTDSMERKIEQAWGAPIHNLYSASESIYIAVKETGQKETTVLDDLNILEVLDEADLPVASGGQGHVVLTNLYNYTLPILRYELGDYVVRGTPQQNSPFTTIRGLQGKGHEVLPVTLNDGTHDTIHSFNLVAFYAAGLERVQFISRRPDHVQIDYVAERNVDKSIRKEFQRILDMKGALRTTFEVRQVSHITNDPQTGKLRAVRIEAAHAESAQISLRHRPVQDLAPARLVGPTNDFIRFKKEDIEQSIADRFQQQVAMFPGRIAVKTKHHQETYDSLNRAANRLARAICAQYENREKPVVLLLEKDAPLITAILGVLKAGFINIPIEPEYPRERISYILSDSQAGLILTNNEHLPLAREFTGDGYQLINVDEITPDLCDENLNRSISPESIAQILYTSGSTGRPKGVIQNHRNVLHNVMNLTNSFHICYGDRLTQLHASSFSSGMSSTFCALLNGASLYPLNFREEVNLAEWLASEEITIYHSPATLFRHFAATLTDSDHFPRLRLIHLANEPVFSSDVALYKKHFHDSCLLVNSYGTTEALTFRFYCH